MAFSNTTATTDYTFQTTFFTALGPTIAGALVCSVLSAFILAGKCCADNRTHSSSELNDSVNQRTEDSMRWWFVRRLPLDLLRCAALGLFLAIFYKKWIMFSISTSGFVIYDISILILISTTRGNDCFYHANRNFFLFYTLIAGFPVGSYTKTAVALYYDDVYELPVASVVGPACVWVTFISLVFLFIYLCCFYTKNSDQFRCCCCQWCLAFIVSLVVFSIWLVFLAIFLYEIFTNGMRPKSDNILDQVILTGFDILKRTTLADETSWLSSFIDSSANWSFSLGAVWIALFLVIVAMNGFIGHLLLLKGKKKEVVLLLQDDVNLLGYIATMLLMSYSYDVKQETSWWWSYGIQFYPMAATETFCLIYDVVLCCVYRDRSSENQPEGVPRSCNCLPRNRVSDIESTPRQISLPKTARKSRRKDRNRCTCMCFKRHTKVKQSGLIKWTNRDLVEWCANHECGVMATFKHEIKKQNLTGNNVCNMSSEECKSLFKRDRLEVQKFLLEILKVYLTDEFPFDQHKAYQRGETWIKRYRDVLQVTGALENIEKISTEWVTNWLRNFGFEDEVLERFEEVFGIDGMMMLCTDFKDSEVSTLLGLSPPHVDAIESGKEVMALVTYDITKLDTVAKFVDENPFHILFPFRGKEQLDVWMKFHHKYFIDRSCFHGGVLLFPPLDSIDELIRDIDGTSAKIAFLDVIKDLYYDAKMEWNKIQPHQPRRLTPLPNTRATNTDKLEAFMREQNLNDCLRNINERIDRLYVKVTNKITLLTQVQLTRIEREKTIVDITERKKEPILVPNHWMAVQTRVHITSLIESGGPRLHSPNIRIVSAVKDLVQKSMQNKTFNIEVTGVQQIQNPKTWQHYASKRQEFFQRLNESNNYDIPSINVKTVPQNFKLKYPRGPVLTTTLGIPALDELLDSRINEVFLFHGTSSTVVDTVITNGLDDRLSGESAGKLFGAGIYAAESATMSAYYAGDPKDDEYKMFVVRVVLGDSFLADDSEDHSKLRRPPCKQCFKYNCAHKENFDSLVGKLEKRPWREFVVFDRYMCYTEFLLTFKKS